MSLRPAFIFSALLVPAVALAGPPAPKEALGTWAPGGDCRAGATVVVDAEGMTLRWQGKDARYDHVDVDLTCYSGASKDSATFCISPVVGNRYPFTLVFNPPGEGRAVRFDVGIGGSDLPPSGSLWRRCE